MSKGPDIPKEPFYVHCADCSHEFIAFYAPIQLSLIKRFKNAACPMCASKNVLTGKANNEEENHKQAAK